MDYLDVLQKFYESIKNMTDEEFDELLEILEPKKNEGKYD